MVVNARSLKRVKRRVTADLHDFLTFPSPDALGGGVGGGTFRSNVKDFLTCHALMPPPSSLFPYLLTWQVLLRVGDLTVGPDASPVVICLDIIEEDVPRSRSVYCDQCRVVGWSGHPVCTKRYHIIVKSDAGSIGGHVKPCTKCGYEVHLSEPRCKCCNHLMTADDVEDWMYQQLEDTTHLLHGVIHANGYGHLLRINGREGGSRFISGTHIMDFWDRLCKYLGVRKISVMDVSKKYGMEYRLLHAITKGNSWYGEWGYEFGAGSFALTLESYQEAVDTLSTLPLSIFICQGRKPRCHLQDLLLFYQSLAEHELVNIRDLFDFLLTLVHDSPRRMSSPVQEEPLKKRRSIASDVMLCAWTSGDIKRVEDAMIRILMAVTGPNWVSWRTLRFAVCKVAPPVLLDYCLKELGGKQVKEGIFVHARCNPDSGALEFRLDSGNLSLSGSSGSTNFFASTLPSKNHLIRDLRLLYESLLFPQTMANFVPEFKRDLATQAATKLLDCKQFVKDYKPENYGPLCNDPSTIYLFCKVQAIDQSEHEPITPPPEPILLPHNATLTDLKNEASKVFQEVYVMFRGFQAEELLEYRGVGDSMPLKLLLESHQTVLIQGKCLVKHGLGRFRMERGLERWTVDCACGAKDDDGERMLACDLCGVWQHTRCAGILDFDIVPARFVCWRCRGVQPLKTGGTIGGGSKCKDEVGAVAVSGGGGKSVPRCFMGANLCLNS